MRRLTLLGVFLCAVTLLARDTRVWSVDEAYRQHRTHVLVSGAGTVVKVLRDDNVGSRHQRFLLDAGGGRSLLVAHNIDVARRVVPLRKGNRIEFRGEYIWNPKGGILHWTHHDPSGRHAAGWLMRNGEKFD